MSATLLEQYTTVAKSHNLRLAAACHREFGVDLIMYKIAKQFVYLGTLLLSAYAINEGAEPFIALLFAAIIISGPEMLEWWLIKHNYDDMDTE